MFLAVRCGRGHGGGQLDLLCGGRCQEVRRLRQAPEGQLVLQWRRRSAGLLACLPVGSCVIDPPRSASHDASHISLAVLEGAPP